MTDGTPCAAVPQRRTNLYHAAAVSKCWDCPTAIRHLIHKVWGEMILDAILRRFIYPSSAWDRIDTDAGVVFWPKGDLIAVAIQVGREFWDGALLVF